MEKIKLELGVKTIGREVMGGDRVYEVREGVLIAAILPAKIAV